ncbi:MAG: DUF308 domain-containing protein [Clostridia bacterium]|nr:DUF308 domain-containing protein [Clostridia bacterium]
MNSIEKIFKKTGWLSILTSLVLAALGGVLIWKPTETVKFVSYALGAIFIIVGIAKVINYFLSRGKYEFYNYDLVFGLMAIVLGIITICCSSTIGSIFRIIIGIWIVYSSIIRLNLSFKLKSMDVKAWIYSFILAILMFICGLYVALSEGSIVIAIGIVIVIYAVIDIAESIIFMRNVKDIF